ncbi:MAG: hydrolase [Candidatus Aminicenantes bacterium]|nr:hydrolase [Candidatus Aminicenantes bacterium]
MKIRAVQFSPALGNVSKNMEYHRIQIKKAIADNCDLIIFPELSLSGYHLKDIVYEIALNPESKEIAELAELSKKIDIVVGLPYEQSPGIIYNSALYFSRGKCLHNHKKVQLPNFGMFQEEMIFKAGNTFKSFKIKNFTVGMIICREILFPVHAYLYYLQGVDFLVGISNSPFRGLKKDHFASLQLWEKMGYVCSVFYHQHYIYVNRTGFEDGIGFTGGSFFARSGKGIEKKAKYFEEDEIDFEMNLEDVSKARIAGNYLRDEKPEIILKELKRILNA